MSTNGIHFRISRCLAANRSIHSRRHRCRMVRSLPARNLSPNNYRLAPSRKQRRRQGAALGSNRPSRIEERSKRDAYAVCLRTDHRYGAARHRCQSRAQANRRGVLLPKYRLGPPSGGARRPGRDQNHRGDAAFRENLARRKPDRAFVPKQVLRAASKMPLDPARTCSHSVWRSAPAARCRSNAPRPEPTGPLRSAPRCPCCSHRRSAPSVGSFRRRRIVPSGRNDARPCACRRGQGSARRPATGLQP
jgi:hypothetical protein